MSKKSDDGLWDLVSRNLRPPDWRLTRIETGMTAAGVPDVSGASRLLPGDFWIELKATDGWRPVFRPLQVGWATLRTEGGSRVYIMTRRRCAASTRRPAADQLWIHHGRDIREVAEGGLQAADPLGMWCGGPGGWDWDEVERTIAETVF